MADPPAASENRKTRTWLADCDEGLTGDEQVDHRVVLQRARPGLKAKITVEELELKNDEGLPDTYEPVPESEWISPRSELFATSD